MLCPVFFFVSLWSNGNTMDINKLDRSKFLFDPLDPDLLEKLSRHKEFTSTINHLNRTKVTQYIILMYDKNNDDVRAEIPYYPQRKYEVAKCVGLIEGKRKPKPTVEDMLIGKNKAVNAMIIRYLTLFNDPDLIMLAAYYQIFIELNKQSFSGDFTKDTIAGLEKVNSKIKELTENVYGGKDETELRAELYKSIEEQSLGIRPEEIAEKIQSGKDIFDHKYSPYDEQYIPDELKFLGS